MRPWWPGLVCTGRHLLHEAPRGLWLSVGINHPSVKGWGMGGVWTGASVSRLPRGSWPLYQGSQPPERSLPLTVRFCQGRILHSRHVCGRWGRGCSLFCGRQAPSSSPALPSSGSGWRGPGCGLPGPHPRLVLAPHATWRLPAHVPPSPV